MTNHGSQDQPEGPQEGSLWRNLCKILFLIAVLTAAWFLLDRLIN